MLATPSLILIALLLGLLGGALVSVWRRRNGASLWLACLPLACAGWAYGEYALVAAQDVPAASAAAAADEKAPLILPEGWPEGHPVPEVKSNCVRCHLGAGRELTLAVAYFAHSVHDLNYLSCADCHGGNTEDDALAHDEAFGFIGTKLSAHLAHCAECHSDQAEVLDTGPHAWDWSKRINLDYPMCVDCHGNHDVGNPPADFRLKLLCTDCHEDETSELFPHLTSVIEQNDLLWQTLVKVHKKNSDAEELVPAEFQDQIQSLRTQTMQYVHESQELSAEQAQTLNDEVEQLRGALEKWLAEGS